MKRKPKADTVDWITVLAPKNILLILVGTSLAVLAMKCIKEAAGGILKHNAHAK